MRLPKYINDFKNDNGIWVKTVQMEGRSVSTKSFRVWNDMMSRGKPGGSHQSKFPSYRGVSVCNEWYSFKKFADWHTVQVGYSSDNYQLDKDLLVPGNLEYSPHNCCLIPKALNMFFVSLAPSRIRKYMGVSETKQGKFRCCTTINGVSQHIGTFIDRDTAYLAFIEAKTNEARRWFHRLESVEFNVSAEVMYTMNNWTFEKHCIDAGLSHVLLNPC